MLAGMDWLAILLIAIATPAVLCAAGWAFVGWCEGNRPVEMPDGETIFGAPRQPERPSPHRTLGE